ncbi:FUN14 domain-containing protein [Thermocrinis minervae]|uniref:Uncharacterized membrane protein, Fun14 family n=1 Tax=Thermocrinis minervae TaxID=381751 RepID=A0A1M6QAH7_9AQUI|nr:FUN14 domain-containing protein [Thermocrinis minervae]SHK17140.1 Uncharacterized membrane protein, Fun14 family [Thermocrinis minervae]
MDTVLDLGFAGLAGYALGYTIKRLMHFLFVLFGLYVLSLLWLESKGIITVEWKNLLHVFGGMFSGFNSFTQSILKKLAFSGTFAMGFFLGFKS